MKKPQPAPIRPNLKALSDERKRLSVEQGLVQPATPPISAPVVAEPAQAPPTMIDQPVVPGRLETGSPEYSAAYTKARDQFENTNDPNSTKIGPNLRRNNVTGEDMRFPGPGEWQPDPQGLWGTPQVPVKAPDVPQRDPGEVAATNDLRTKLSALQGGQPNSWQYQATIPVSVTGSSDTPPTTGPDGKYDEWLFDRYVNVTNDQALDGLMRDQFDAVAADNPIAAANLQHIGDLWRVVQALTPPGGAPAATPTMGAAPAQGKPAAKGTPEDRSTVGLPWGKQYPTVEAMFQDWTAGAAGAANEVLGIKPAKGAEAQAASPPPMTPEQAMQYLTGGNKPAAPSNKGPLDTARQVIGSAAVTFRENTKDALGRVIPGVYGGVKAALDGIDGISIGVADQLGNVTGIDFLKEYAKGGLGIPEVNAVFGEPSTPMGHVSQGISQFLTGFVTGGKALEGLGWAAGTAGIAGQTVRVLAQGAIADAGFFDGQSGKLSDLLVQVPALQNPVTEFLKTDPNDSEAEGRFKNALNGLMAAPLVPTFIAAVQAIKGGVQMARLARTGLPETASAPGSSALTTKPAAPASLLGDASPEAALTLQAVADPVTGKLATAATEVAAKGYTPIGGGPAGGPQVFANFAAIRTPDDIQKIANEMVAAFEGTTDAARQGVITNAATKAAAGEVDAFDTLMSRRTGEAPNAAQVYAWRSLYEGSLRKLQEVAGNAANSSLMDAPTALLQMREMETVVLAIQKEFYGARAEAGRALQAFKIAPDNAFAMKQIEGLLSQYGGIDANVALARKIAAIDDPAKLADFITGGAMMKSRKAWEQWFYFSVLSSFKTHIRNTVGNSAMLALDMAETGLAAQMAKVAGSDSVQVGEALAQWYGVKAAFGSALQAAGRTWKTGQSTGGFGLNKIDAPVRMNAISAEAWGLSQTSTFGRAIDALGAVTMVPGRLLATSDEFFKTVGSSATGYQQAFKQAQREVAEGKIKPDGLADRVTELVADFPNRLTDDMKSTVVEKAAYLTFTNPPKPGGVTDTLLKLREIGSQPDSSIAAQVGGMAARTILPFINTPSNILLATFERTPLAPVTGRYRDAIRQGGAAAYQANARMALGSMTMATWVDMVEQGNITGAGPSDRAAFATLQATGWRPYSFKVGDKYISYQGVEPISTVLGWAAVIGEMMSNTDVADPTAQQSLDESIGAATFAMFDLVLSKSYMQGASDFLNAVNSGDANAAQVFVQKWGGGQLVPNIARDVATAIDPVQRYTTSILDNARARIPGMSAALPARRDAFGFVKSYQSGFGTVYDAISPFYASTMKDLPIASAMLKDGWAIGMPPQAFTIEGQRVDISNQPDIYSRFLELRGQVKPTNLTAKVPTNYAAGDKYASGEAAQTWADRLQDRYGDRNMVEVLNGVVGESPPFDLVDLAQRYHSFTDADNRRRFILSIKDDFQDAAKAVLFSEYPDLLSRAARLKEAGQEIAP